MLLDSMEESVMFWMSEKEFRATLTPKQLDIYLNCIIGGQSKLIMLLLTICSGKVFTMLRH